MKEFLTLIGALAITITIGFTIIVLVDCIKELIQKILTKYKQKHRFDKPPTAKCYCIDCSSYDRETGKCYIFNCNTADDCFCRNADPRNRS